MDIDAGDILYAELDPVLGREQGGRRPALVLTSADFHAARETAVICPITSNTADWPTKVLLPDGLDVKGAVLVEQIRTVHRESRLFGYAGRVPPSVMRDVHSVLVDMLKIKL